MTSLQFAVLGLLVLHSWEMPRKWQMIFTGFFTVGIALALVTQVYKWLA